MTEKSEGAKSEDGTVPFGVEGVEEKDETTLSGQAKGPLEGQDLGSESRSQPRLSSGRRPLFRN
jgi:hypothetical protein